MNKKPDLRSETKPLSEHIVKRIVGAIQSIEFGTVQITIHHARVVQIDKIERIRVLRDDEVEDGSYI